MSFLNAHLEELDKQLAFLKKTRLIDEGDLELPEYAWLDEQYRTVRDGIGQIVVSIMNSMIFQRRIGCGITRDLTRELARNDANWKRVGRKPPGFKNERWPELVKLLCQALGTVVSKEPKKPMVFRVTNPELLRFLIVDGDQQIAQVRDLIAGDEVGDAEGDVVVSSKEIVVSSEKEVVSEGQHSPASQGEIRENSEARAATLPSPSEDPTPEVSAPPPPSDPMASLASAIGLALKGKNFLDADVLSGVVKAWFRENQSSLSVEEFMPWTGPVLQQRFKVGDAEPWAYGGEYSRIVYAKLVKAYQACLENEKLGRVFGKAPVAPPEPEPTSEGAARYEKFRQDRMRENAEARAEVDKRIEEARERKRNGEAAEWAERVRRSAGMPD